MYFNEYLFFSGFEVIKYRRKDRSIVFMSLMDNITIPTAIDIGEKYIYFIYDLYNILEHNKKEEGTLLNSINNSLDRFIINLPNVVKTLLKRSSVINFIPFIQMEKLKRRCWMPAIENEKHSLNQISVMEIMRW